MDRNDLITFYPQFRGFTPAVVMEMYVALANERFGSFGQADAEEARRLWTAHRLTLYAASVPEGDSPDAAAIAAAGMARQKIASKKVGEVAVTYASRESASASGLEDLAETAFGLQLLSLLRQYSFSRYIP